MANQTQDVELRIRATNYSKQTTDKVVDALKQMTQAQDAQLESARKGTTTVAQLEASYAKLESAVKALVGQNSVIKLFQAQSATLGELQTKLDAARKAQQDFSNSLEPGAARSKKQEAEIMRLGRALAAAEKQFMRAEGRIQTTSARLAEFGVNSANMAATQQKIAAAVTTANGALERQEAAIHGNDAALAASRAASAAALAQRQAQIRVDTVFEQAQRDAAAAIAARDAAVRSSLDGQRRADIAFTNAQRVATEEINRRNAALVTQQAALRAAADQAERLMRASSATTRGSAPVVGPNLAGSLRDIANPADAAVRSVSGIETAIAGLETRVRSLRGPVQDYRGGLEEARRAQAALAAVAGQVDGYQRQLTALRAARAEYTQTRAAVATLIAEMRSGAAGEDITTRLARAQSTLAQAAANLGNVTTAARTTREALTAAGVNTRNLTAAEAALVAQANRAAGALQALTDAFNRNGAAANSAGSRIFSWFGGNGRTTLTYAQRMRGELLGMAAGFMGLQAAVGLAKDSLTAYNATQGIMSRLVIAAGGDARKGAEEFAYLERQADRIGFVFLAVAPAYAKFAIATKAAGFTTQETRFSFEQIAASAVKARLSTDELTGVMKAFEQIASKGKVQAEELRGQLGDRLPGAFQIAARAAGKTVEEYTKLMELGEIGSEQVIGIAREMGKTYGAASAGTESLLTAQARFENASNRFKTSTAEGGFVEAYTAFLVKLTDLLNSGQGDVLAKQLSAGFVAVIDAMSFVADNIDLITFAIKALLAVQFMRWLATLPALFLAVKAEVVALNGVMLILTGRITALQIVNGLTAALGSMGLAGAAASLSGALGVLAIALRGVAMAIPILGAAAAAYYATTAIMDSRDDGARERVKASIAATTKAFQDAAKANEEYQKVVGKKDEARFKAQYERFRALAVDAQKKQDAEVAAARKNNLTDNGNEEIGKALGRQSRTLGGSASTADPGERPGQALKNLSKQLDAEDKRLEKASRATRLRGAKDELAERLQIVDERFQAMRDQYRVATKDETEYQEGIKAINKRAAAEAAIERQKYANEQRTHGTREADRRKAIAADVSAKLKEIEADIAKRNANADPTEPYETRRTARINAIGHAYDALNKKIAEMEKFSPQQAASEKVKLDLLREQRKTLEGENSDRDESARLLKVFSDQQSIMKGRIEEINTLYDTGAITQAQQLERLNAVATELGPTVAAAGQAALTFAQSIRATLDPVEFQNTVTAVGVGIAKANQEASVATNNLKDAQTTLNAVLAEQARAIELISTKRKLGIYTSEEEAAALNRNATDFQSKIVGNIDAVTKLAQAQRDAGMMSKPAFDQLVGSMTQLKTETANAQLALSEVGQTIVGSVTNNGTAAFEQLGAEIAKVASGAHSIGDGFKAALGIVGQFFAQLLRDIAMAIIKQLILKAITTAIGGPVGAAAGVAGGAAGAAGGAIAPANHNGGLAGMNSTFRRRVDASAFFRAPRYHSGGLAGFAPNEVPSILLKNEEVLTRDDPRHVLNGGKAGGGGGDSGSNRFVLVDDRKNVAQAMNTSEGEKVTLVHLKNNLPTLKQWLK